MHILFQNVRVDLSDAALMLYGFALDYAVCEMQKMLPALAQTTIIRFFAKLRKILFDEMESIMMEDTIHGETQIVEIDESLFGKKQKNNRGCPTKRFWIFGMVQRETRKTYFTPVQDRTEDTLVSILKARVKPGSMIYHDDWSAYRKLHKQGYEHDVVVHTREFVSKSGACTNTIEGRTLYLHWH